MANFLTIYPLSLCGSGSTCLGVFSTAAGLEAGGGAEAGAPRQLASYLGAFSAAAGLGARWGPGRRAEAAS